METQTHIPRFFINTTEWLSELLGEENVIVFLQDLLPDLYSKLNYRTIPTDFITTTKSSHFGIQIINDDNTTVDINKLLSSNTFFAILGYNKIPSTSPSFGFTEPFGLVDLIININSNFSSFGAQGGRFNIPQEGFSLIVQDENGVHSWNDATNSITIYSSNTPYYTGSAILGTYYTMTSSPNLSITTGREYPSKTEIITHNGSSISNTLWDGTPSWGNLPAWELNNFGESMHTKKLSRSGRRFWDINFSYLFDDKLWGSNQSIYSGDMFTETNYDSTDIVNGNFNYNLLTDMNFFSQVWHKTISGSLPFIFQPNIENSNSDDFFMTRFVENSLKVKQTSANVFDISLKLKESW